MTVHHEADMPDTMDDLRYGVRMMRQRSAQTWEAWAQFVEVTLTPHRLDRKTKEFIALGMSITSQCKYCIGMHVQKALDAGASADEIIEVCQIAMLMGGSPAMTYVAEVRKALDLYEEKQEMLGDQA